MHAPESKDPGSEDPALVIPRGDLVIYSMDYGVMADWNENLRALAEAEEQYKRLREKDRKILDEGMREKIRELASNFPGLWNDPGTPQRERKRMVHLLLEDVTLVKNGEDITVHVRFKGGAAKTLNFPRPLTSLQEWTTDTKVVAEIDRLLDHHTNSQVASILWYGRNSGRR